MKTIYIHAIVTILDDSNLREQLITDGTGCVEMTKIKICIGSPHNYLFLSKDLDMSYFKFVKDKIINCKPIVFPKNDTNKIWAAREIILNNRNDTIVLRFRVLPIAEVLPGENLTTEAGGIVINMQQRMF